MSIIYSGYVGGDYLYLIEGNELFEPWGGGAPVATFRDGHVFFGRRVDSRPAATLIGNEVFNSWGNASPRMGYIENGRLLMDQPGGQVLMSADEYAPEALAMACALRYGDDSLRRDDDLRNNDSMDGHGEFYNYPGNYRPGSDPADYDSWSRRNAGYGDEKNEEECGETQDTGYHVSSVLSPPTGYTCPGGGYTPKYTPEEWRSLSPAEQDRVRHPLAKRENLLVVAKVRLGVYFISLFAILQSLYSFDYPSTAYLVLGGFWLVGLPFMAFDIFKKKRHIKEYFARLND